VAYIYNDNLFKNSKNEVFTQEYMTNNGKFNPLTKEWHINSNTVEVMTECNDILYKQGQVIRCNYDQIFFENSSLILCNAIAEDFDYLGLESGFDDEDEDDNDILEIFQYYIVDSNTAEFLKEHTNEHIFYHNRLDIYILGVTHFGTSWDYVGMEFKTRI